MPVTLKDVAREARVSNTTASRVLTGKPSTVPIGAATRQRVTETASRLGYRPNLMARGLRTQRSGTVGVMVEDITDPFFAALIPEIDTVFKERGYHIILSHVARDPHPEPAYDRLLGAWIDGLLMLGDPALERDLEAEILAHHRHVISIAHDRDDTLIPSVNVDDTEGVRLAVNHLLGLGHRHIGFVGSRFVWDMEKRLEAFRGQMTAHGLEVPPQAIDLVPHTAADGYAATKRLLATKTPLSALLCAADSLALGALCAVHEAGLQVPQEISIVGFDDIPLAAYATPPLTTVRQPVAALARTAALLLLDAIEGVPAMSAAPSQERTQRPVTPSDATGRHHGVLLSPELVIRQSTGRYNPC